MLLWPLYFTSFLIDDFLDDESMFGDEDRRALQRLEPHLLGARLSALPARRDRGGRPDLARERRVHRVAGRLRQVVPYEEIDSIEAKPAVYVDMSGDAKVRSAVHGHFGDELKHSAAVGITHREDLGGADELAGPKPVFFFAPDRLRKRTAGLGSRRPQRAARRGLGPYVEWTRSWLRVEHGSGAEDVERIYRELLDGKSDPAVGHVLSP